MANHSFKHKTIETKSVFKIHFFYVYRICFLLNEVRAVTGADSSMQNKYCECSKVKYLLEANKPEVCLVSFSSKQKPWGITIFLLSYLSLWALLWENTTHNTHIPFLPLHTQLHTESYLNHMLPCWLRLYGHCIAILSLSHPVHGNRREEQREAPLSECEHVIILRFEEVNTHIHTHRHTDDMQHHLYCEDAHLSYCYE